MQWWARAHQCHTLYWMPTRWQGWPFDCLQSLAQVEQSSPGSHLVVVDTSSGEDSGRHELG